jgi:hypothetical protein
MRSAVGYVLLASDHGAKHVASLRDSVRYNLLQRERTGLVSAQDWSTAPFQLLR